MYLGIGVDRYRLFDVYCRDKDSQSACSSLGSILIFIFYFCFLGEDESGFG